MLHPFEATSHELIAHLDEFVAATYADLQTAILTLPKGSGFVEYPRFQTAYTQLHQATLGFQQLTPEAVLDAMRSDSLVFLVVRTILGLTPPEWASLVAATAGLVPNRGTARTLDLTLRTRSGYVAQLYSSPTRNAKMIRYLEALVRVACVLIADPAPRFPDKIHRLDKVDTAEGLPSLQRAAQAPIPYAMLLYERYLGRPFASQRDSVSELIGAEMEMAIASRLTTAHIPHRRTKRAEKVPGFDQAPDFIVPDASAPSVVIEAKIANDEGTARDKITRIIHLAEISRRRGAAGAPAFEVVACIDGPGFGVRREDMRRLLTHLDGKVFTLRTLDSLIPYSRLAQFAHPAPGFPAED